jgi:transcription elongation factor Elf1
MARKKAKNVAVIDERTEITYEVRCECPYCGDVNEVYICDDDQYDHECDSCRKTFHIDISKLV